MKKLFIIIILVIFVAGCANKTGNFNAYKNLSSEQIFTRAEKSLGKGNYAQAVKDLEALDALYPFGPYAQQGQLDIIYAYYQHGDAASALAATDRYIRLYPRSPFVDYAYYMKGLVNFELGYTWLQRLLGADPAPRDITDKKRAYTAFAQVVDLFPNSPYAHDAAVRMGFLRNVFAKKNVVIAQYYFARRAYVAAANRASYVVEHFGGSPYVIPALVIMIQSYQRLGLDGLANNSLAILKASYPDALQLKKLEKSVKA